jgi:hypothetical protein
MCPCDSRSAITTSLLHVKVTGHKSPVPFIESPDTPDRISVTGARSTHATTP